MKPKFTVIIPTLNEEKYLPNLLDSLITQHLKNFDVVVVDGSSKDKTVVIANSYKRKLKGMKVIVSKKASLPLQRNMGATSSKGEWLAFIDADSVLMPSFFERVTEYIKENKPQLLTTWMRPDSEVGGDALITLFGNMVLESTLLVKKSVSPGPLTLVSRKAFNKVKGYDEAHEFHEDMDFGLRLKKHNINLSIVKESLFVWSLRRMRKQGSLKVLREMAMAALPILFFNKTYKKWPGYIMGGHMYDKKKRPIKKSTLKNFEKKLKKIVKEAFG
ncbi:glycosyltransferase family 2 protein [Patescibacteria group bacterium]